MFSPYYAWSRRRGEADPYDHCALNVALYRRGADRWAMTERRRHALEQTAQTLVIGPSAVNWDGTRLRILIDERTAPLPRRLKGEVRFYPPAITALGIALDADGRHLWQPLAPCGRVEVSFEQPAWHWAGGGYLDSNRGSTPLEDAFIRWDWSRSHLADGAAIAYDVTRRDGCNRTLALRIDRDGDVDEVTPTPPVSLPPSRWRIARSARAFNHGGGGGTPRLVRTLEDAPFYTRSLLTSSWHGGGALIMHESLSLDRFRQWWVQAMLPFRMPRSLSPARTRSALPSIR